MMQDIDSPHKVLLYCSDKHLEVNMDTNSVRVLEQLEDRVATPAEVVAPVPPTIAEEAEPDPEEAEPEQADPQPEVPEGTPPRTPESQIITTRVPAHSPSVLSVDDDNVEDIKIESATSSSDDEVDQALAAAEYKKKWTKIADMRNDQLEAMQREVEDKRAAHAEMLQKQAEDKREEIGAGGMLAVVDIDPASAMNQDIHTSDEETKSDEELDTSIFDKLRKPKSKSEECTPVKKKRGGGKAQSVKAMHIGNSDQPFFPTPIPVGVFPSQAQAGSKLGITASEVSRIVKGHRTYATANGKRYWFTNNMEATFEPLKALSKVCAEKKPEDIKEEPKERESDKRKRGPFSPTVSDTDKSSVSHSTYSDDYSKRQKAAADIGQDLAVRPLSDRPAIPTKFFEPADDEKEKQKRKAARQKKAMEAELFYTPRIVMNSNGFGNTCMGHKKPADVSYPVVGECKHINCLACVMKFAATNQCPPKCLLCNKRWTTWSMVETSAK